MEKGCSDSRDKREKGLSLSAKTSQDKICLICTCAPSPHPPYPPYLEPPSENSPAPFLVISTISATWTQLTLSWWLSLTLISAEWNTSFSFWWTRPTSGRVVVRKERWKRTSITLRRSSTSQVHWKVSVTQLLAPLRLLTGCRSTKVNLVNEKTTKVKEESTKTRSVLGGRCRPSSPEEIIQSHKITSKAYLLLLSFCINTFSIYMANWKLFHGVDSLHI